MRKLRAIWNIIKANKWAVFTYEEAPNDPEWATFPFFRWNVSEKDLGFFRLIRERLFSIYTLSCLYIEGFRPFFFGWFSLVNLFPMLLPFSKSAIPLFIRCFFGVYIHRLRKEKIR